MRASPSPSADRFLWGTIALSVGIRVVSAAYHGDDVTALPGVADQLSYHTLATRVLEGHGFSFPVGWWPATPAGEPTAHWSFLYTLFLVAVYAVAGIHPLVARLIQGVAVGVLQPWLSYRLGTRLFGPVVGRGAAVIAAGYAYFAYYAGALMTESFYVVCILWTVDRLLALGRTPPARRTRWLWGQLGLALALGILLRQTLLFVVPVFAGWLIWRSVYESERRFDALSSTLAGLAVSMAVIALAVLPWTIRNYRVFDTFVLLNTNAGFAFFWGNHPVHGSTFTPLLQDNSYGALIPDNVKVMNEGAMDRELLRRGLRFVADDPGRYLRLSIGRMVEYVKFWPSAESGAASNWARVLSFGVMLPFLLVGLWQALRPSARSHLGYNAIDVGLVVCLVLVHSALYVATWTLVRYRLPVDALLGPFMSLGFLHVCSQLSIAPMLGKMRWSV
ncbi:MAG: glycosyltransferase family 39 protein [Vicinamibacterales bacterium]